MKKGEMLEIAGAVTRDAPNPFGAPHGRRHIRRMLLLSDLCTERADDSDQANDMLIERSQLLGWHPQLPVLGSTDLFDVELRNVLCVDIERRYVSSATVAHVPPLGNLRSVLLAQHRIEDRLLG